MGNDIEKAPEVTLLKSEMEAAAARVAERALNTTLDGVSGLVGDIFGGLFGDNVKQWRNRNLVTTLVKTKGHFDRLGIPIENAKALPMGELYEIFEGMSKQDDPQLSDMWAALLANAMNPTTNSVIDPSLPKVLQQLSGVDAVILKFYNEAASLKPILDGAISPGSVKQEGEKYQIFITGRGQEIVESFGEEIVSSSISNLLRLGLLFVEGKLDETNELVRYRESVGHGPMVEYTGLSDELSNIYYQLNLAYDNVESHKVTHFYLLGGKPTHFLPYDMTRLAKRLLEACTGS